MPVGTSCEANPTIERFVRNRWVWLACLDAKSGTLWEFRSTGFVAHTPETRPCRRHRRLGGVVPGQAGVPAARARSCRRSCATTRGAGMTLGMTESFRLRCWCWSASDCRRFCSCARRRVTGQPPFARAVDWPSRRQLDGDRLCRPPGRLHCVRHHPHRLATALLWCMVDLTRRRHRH